MANKRHEPEEIVSKLRQVDVLRGQGMTMADAIPQIGVTSLTYYRCGKSHGAHRCGWA
jgi:putative transposase